MIPALDTSHEVTAIDKPAGPTSETTSSVIHLTSPITIKENTTILVTCNSTIKIEMSPGSCTVISASTPITITAQSKTTISPTACMGQNFARLWNNLPLELKEHVLSFNLIAEEHIDGSKPEHHQKTLLQHLAMGPDIAPVARQVFYGQNAFNLALPERRGGNYYLPPTALRPLIKKLTLDIGYNAQCWNFMRQLTAGSHGFDNLQKIRVRAMPCWSRWRFMSHNIMGLQPESFVHFQCKGEVEFRNTDADAKALKENVWARDGFSEEEVLATLKQLITFAGTK